MPSGFGISKKSVRLFIYLFLVGISLALVYGYCQLTRYAEPFPVEWAGEADSTWLQFATTDIYSGRVIFVSHTPFGKRMVGEYLDLFQAANPGAHIERHSYYSVIASDQNSLHVHRYLDYFAFARLQIKHLQRFLIPKSVKAITADHSSEPHLQALFTRGMYKQPDNTLVDQLRFLVQNARPGSYIRISIFLFFYTDENEPILLDLLSAAERGVNVQLITDLPEADNPAKRGIGHIFQAGFTARMQAAATKGRSDSWIKNHSRVAWESKNHTKIFLFSDSAGFQKWLIISSENLTDTERQKYQAGLLMRDKASYDAFETYWKQILDGSYQDLWSASNGENLSHYFFPQTASEDEIYHQLDQIMASVNPGKAGKLSISMARWNFERFPLAMKLVEIAERGVNIEIITRNNPQIVDDIILRALSHRPNITLHTADVDRLNIHSKYVLYEGFYRGEDAKILWVGSHNFTGMAMRNNYETWTEVRDDKIFQEFSDNFAELKSLVPVDSSSANVK
jgi:HKD family nuclease